MGTKARAIALQIQSQEQINSILQKQIIEKNIKMKMKFPNLIRCEFQS